MKIVKGKRKTFKTTKSIGLGILTFLIGAFLAVPFTTTPSAYEDACKEKEELVLLLEEKSKEVADSDKKLSEAQGIKSNTEIELRKLNSKEVALKTEVEKLVQAKEEAERLAQEEAKRKDILLASSGNSNNSNSSASSETPIGKMVWKTKTGKKYHSKNNCGNTDPSSATQITLSQAEAQGLTPCSKCY